MSLAESRQWQFDGLVEGNKGKEDVQEVDFEEYEDLKFMRILYDLAVRQLASILRFKTQSKKEYLLSNERAHQKWTLFTIFAADPKFRNFLKKYAENETKLVEIGMSLIEDYLSLVQTIEQRRTAAKGDNITLTSCKFIAGSEETRIREWAEEVKAILVGQLGIMRINPSCYSFEISMEKLPPEREGLFSQTDQMAVKLIIRDPPPIPPPKIIVHGS